MATTNRKSTVDPAARPRAVALAVAAAFLPWCLPQTAYGQAPDPNTLPTGGQITNGAGQIHAPQGTHLQIDQYTHKMIAEFGSFSIGANASVNLSQPGASSIALFRDVGGDPSKIFGNLTANGQLFISNQNGVLFGASARVDVGALFATSLSITDHDFMAGRYHWTNEGNAGSVVNQGQIVTANGYTALVGPQVRNDGIIIARAGSVALAAGDRVSLDMIGDGLISVSVDQSAYHASVINTGSIAADGGTVLLTARSANALLDTVINNSGTIRANSLVERNGQIVLDGGNTGVVSVTGTLQAAGLEAGTTGGTVKVLGDKVGLFGSALVDASGDVGGGTILIGGNFQGKGLEANASRTYVGTGVRISADATSEGDGGEVIVWADEGTRFYGTLSARGGNRSGNGGFAEISGKGSLDFRGSVDLGAANGAAGTVLFDPLNITISTAADANTAGFTVVVDQTEAFGDDGALNSNFDVTAVTGSFAGVATGTTIELQAENNITLETNFNLDTATGNTGVNLTLRAGNNVDLGTGFTITSSGGHISATANDNGGGTASGAGGILGDANIVTTGVAGGNAGTVTLSIAGTSTGTISVGNITAIGANGATNAVGGNGGAVSLTAIDGNVTAGAIQTSAGNAGAADAGGQFAGGNAGSVTLQVTGATAPRSISVGAITSTGGTGSTATTVDGAGGAGGLGGVTTVTATVGSGASFSASSITTTGGTGGASLGATTGGTGGNGGGAIVSVSQAATISGDITTSGGTGGSNAAAGTAGNGGNAAAISVTSTTANVSVAGITATGGAAGAPNGGTAGTAGTAASATISAATDILLNASINVGTNTVSFNFGQGGTGGVLTIPAVSITAGAVSANGGAGNDTFNIGAWGATGSANGAAGDDTFNISTSLTADLLGGANADSFVFADGAVLTGTIDGGGGSDTLNLSAYTTALTVNLNSAGGIDGATGTTAGVLNPVSGGFSDIDVVSGGTNGDTFNVNASVAANLNGNGGADSFVFGDTFALTGAIDGGGGSDTISWAAYTTARLVTLSATGVTDGFNGSEASITSFTNIDTLTGGGAIDRLVGFTTTATWGIDGSNTYTSGASTLGFSGFENLTGGGGVDTFNVTAAHAGNLSGGAGVDVFGLDATLTGSIDGQIDGGTLAGTQVVNATLTAAGGTAGFNGTTDAAALVGTFNNITQINANGGGTLHGLNTASTWDVDANAYTDTVSTRTLSHSGFATLQGSSAIDTFTLSANATANLAGGDAVDVFDLGGFTLTGSVAGQAAGGTLSGVVNAALTAPGTDTGFDGTSTEVSLGFSDINTINGTGTLQGLNTVSTWDVDANTYTDSVSTRTLSHSGFATLQGGSAIDTFNVSALVTKNIAGGAGVDVFNLDAALTGTIDGQAAGGTLAGTQVVNATLTAAGGTAGFNGTTDAAALVGTFNNITQINANGGGTLHGLNTASAWDVDANTYTDTVSTRTLSHSGFATLQGGNAIDTFNVSGVVTKNLAGGDGVDVFNLDAALTGTIDGQAAGGTLVGTQVVNATLTAAGGSAGFNGTTDAAALLGTFSNITTINANGGGALHGLNTASTWDVDANTYTDTVSTRTLSHSGFATLQGGSAIDTFNVSAVVTKNLAGGDGMDVFNLDAALTGTIDGQAAGGTLAGTQVVSAALTAAGGTAGFNGTTDATALVGTFSNITTINANGGGTLAGLNTVSSWDVDAGSYTDTVSTRTLSHSGFATLQGGSAIDTFTLSANAAASLAGGDAVDVFDMGGFTLTGSVAGQAAGGSITGIGSATLTNQGTTTGFDGTSANVAGNFTDITNLSGTGTLTGRDVASTWALDGTPTYSDGTRTLDIAGFANLQGGTGADTFNVTLASTFNVLGGAGADVFTINAALTGSVSGETGSDTLQGTQIGSTTLTASTAADGFSGTTTGVTGFSGIDVLNGSGTLTGRDVASTWSVDGATYTDGVATLTHSGFGTLQGGTAIDIFTLVAAASGTLLGGDGADVFNINAALLTGSVNGEVGNDTLNGSTTYVINGANAGTASNVSAGFSNIENLVGTAGADSFTLSGGTLAGTVDGLAGTDTLTGGNVPNAWTITGPNSGTLTGTGGWSNIENLAGGTGNDSFNGIAGSVGGTISDGGGGTTTLLGTIISGGNQTYTAAVSAGTVILNAGTASISATNAANNFTGQLSVTGSSASITDMNALTIGANLTGGLTTNSGALTYVAGMSVGNLSSTASGAVIQTGAITVGGATNINAGGNAITLASANDFQGTLSLVGGTTQVRDANALTLGNVNVGAFTAITTGALNLGTVNASALSATTNGGNITQSGPANVTGATNLQAGGGSITLALANDFGGVVAASGVGIILNDVNTLTPGTINAGSGSVSLSANSLGAGGPVSAGSASSMSSNTNVNGLNINMPNVPLALSGAATQWNFISTPTSIAQPNPVTVTGSNVGVTYNLASIIASVAQQQAASASSSVSATVAAVIVEEANKTFGTDSVAEDVEYGFAGEVGATPPMDHRIDESGISLPRCVQESRDGMPCK